MQSLQVAYAKLRQVSDSFGLIDRRWAREVGQLVGSGGLNISVMNASIACCMACKEALTMMTARMHMRAETES